MDVTQCRKCGHWVRDEKLYCSECGASMHPGLFVRACERMSRFMKRHKSGLCFLFIMNLILVGSCAYSHYRWEQRKVFAAKLPQLWADWYLLANKNSFIYVNWNDELNKLNTQFTHGQLKVPHLTVEQKELLLDGLYWFDSTEALGTLTRWTKGYRE